MENIKSIRDYVYNFISNGIKEGRLKANDRVNEKLISEQLGVSRTPIRESLIELANEGYLVHLPRRGFRVKPVSVKEVNEIYLIIGLLEGLAASLALPNLCTDDFVAMEELIKNMDKSIKQKDEKNFYILQKKFHDLFIERSDNNTLKRILNSLKDRFLRQAYIGYKTDKELHFYLKKFNEQHRSILRMLRSSKIEELKKFLVEVHWTLDYARMDSDDLQ